MWRFLEKGAFNRAGVLRKINDYFGQDGGQSDENVVPEPCGTFVKYDDELEEQEEDEEDGYYDPNYTFDEACLHLDLICPPQHRFDKMVERSFRY